MASFEAADVGPTAGHEILRHRPSAALAGSVLRITGYRETVRAAIRQTETASLVVPLIISFGAPFAIGLGRAPGDDDRFASFAAGLFGGPVHIRSHGEAHCLQIDFTPPGAYRFFGLPMHLLADRMVPLDDLADADLATLRQALGEARNWPTRFALVEGFVGARLARGKAASPAVAWAYESLVATGGGIAIARLADRLDCSRKHLAARFRDEIGAAPKTVARIARFNRATDIARAEKTSGWADVAAACGYADQAHLVREFNDFAGLTPTAWRAAFG